jgi:hypothetical protein
LLSKIAAGFDLETSSEISFCPLPKTRQEIHRQGNPLKLSPPTPRKNVQLDPDAPLAVYGFTCFQSA